MSTNLDSFDGSELGAFNESALNARGESGLGDLIAAAGTGSAWKTFVYDDKEDEWNQFGSDINGRVEVFMVFKNELYMGGAFTTVGGSTVRRFAKWDKDTEDWIEVLGGLPDGTIFDMKAGVLDDMILCGTFTSAGGQTDSERVTRFTGSAFNTFSEPPFNTGPNGTVRGVASALSIESTLPGFDDPELEYFMGGDFTDHGGVTPFGRRIAQTFDSGSAFDFIWKSAPRGLNSSVYDIREFKKKVYACGNFTNSDSPSPGGVAVIGLGSSDKLNFTNDPFRPVRGNSASDDELISSRVMLPWDNNLVIGGLFAGAGIGGSDPITSSRVIEFDGTQYIAIPTLIPFGQVDALVIYKNDLIFGGTFTTVDGDATNFRRVARYDRTDFIALEDGLDNDVGALAVFPLNLVSP